LLVISILFPLSFPLSIAQENGRYLTSRCRDRQMERRMEELPMRKNAWRGGSQLQEYVRLVSFKWR